MPATTYAPRLVWRGRLAREQRNPQR